MYQMAWYLGYILVYLAILVGIAFYYFTKVKTSDQYIISAWNTSFWPLVGTIVSTWCGAAVFIGWVGMGFRVGVSGFFQFALPGIIFCLLLIYFFAKPIRRQKMYTLPDMFAGRFGKEAAIVPSTLSAFVYSVPTTALQLVGMSTIFLLAFNIPVPTGILIATVIMLTFTLLGGLPATIMTDALQSFVLVLGIIVLFIGSLIYAGGISKVLANTPIEYLSPIGPEGLGAVLLFALSVGPFYLIWQSTWQRIYAAKDEDTARSAGLTGFALAGVISILPYSIGIMARGYLPADLNPNLVFSTVVFEVLPPYIGGIVYIGLIAALVTGGTSFLMQGGSNLSRDFYQKLLNPYADNKKMMRASRLSVLIIGVGAFIVAIYMTDIITLYQWALRLSGTMLVFPFLAIMFWKRVTKAGFLGSMAVAGLVTLTFSYWGIGAGLDPAIAGFPASLISLVVISLLTKHSKTEQVKAIYYGEVFDTDIADSIVMGKNIKA